MYAHEIGLILIKVSEVHTLALVRRFSWHFHNSFLVVSDLEMMLVCLNSAVYVRCVLCLPSTMD